MQQARFLKNHTKRQKFNSFIKRKLSLTFQHNISMFRYLVTLSPLGLLYGSAGGFLSPENLVGRSQSKFPPDAGTFTGLILNAARSNGQTINKQKLTVAGPFWTIEDKVPALDFFVPIPWTKIITQSESDEWFFEVQTNTWKLKNDADLKPKYSWQCLSTWAYNAKQLQEAALQLETLEVSGDPWTFEPMLHPYMQENERCVQDKDGLFLEQAVRMNDDTRLVYLSTELIADGWYKFGGENHLVEVECFTIDASHTINQLLSQPIGQSFALITPAVWGSNRRSLRQPEGMNVKALLTDKPTTFRFRSGGQAGEIDPDKRKNRPGRLGRGRYAVKAGSVYILEESRSDTWWDWGSWFPQEGFSLQRLGCGLALPITV
jgi:CRISPR-associated protein Cmr3